MRKILAAAPAAALLTLVAAAPALAAGDPLQSEQWGLAKAQFPRAWSSAKGAGVTIAVVDTGVDLGHPDLRAKLVPGRDFVDGDSEPRDENGHGTHVAGIAAATTSNGIGVAGAAPDAKIMPVRVLDAEGNGDENAIADGIVWAAENGARVVNLSLGESGFSSRLSKGGPLNAAIRRAASLGAVVVAAAGNEGTRKRNYRIAVPVLVVGAVTETGAPAEFSNTGDPRSVVAPGKGVLSTTPTYPTTLFQSPGSGYGRLDGTSMAAPYVSGLAAVLLSQGRSAADVADVIRSTTAGAGRPGYGAGLVDAAAAVAAPGAPPPSPAPTAAPAPGDAPSTGAGSPAHAGAGSGDPSATLPYIYGAAAVVAVLTLALGLTRRRTRPRSTT